jgi:hypothetical protein
MLRRAAQACRNAQMLPFATWVPDYLDQIANKIDLRVGDDEVRRMFIEISTLRQAIVTWNHDTGPHRDDTITDLIPDDEWGLSP